MSELARLLDERFPGRDAFALGQAIRAWVPPRGVWGKSGRAALTSVEEGQLVEIEAIAVLD